MLSFFTLLRLRQRPLPATAGAIWAVFIVVVPFLGALAFLIVQPGRQTQ
ncbi:MAG: PLDc N-terminal domain-containing protein [Anaerolineae bacterium]|nr:PLDc N-terminal domain-containing protein [Anaerolineae bacterium]